MTPESEPIARELARELSHPDPLPPMPLFTIERELQELLELRENAEAEGALPAELAVIDQRAHQYMLALKQKVDAISHAIRASDTLADICERESKRLAEKAARHRNQKERIKAWCLQAMQTLGVKSFETATNRLRVQVSGGIQALETDLSKLSRGHQLITVTVPLPVWEDLIKRNSFNYHEDGRSADTVYLRKELSRKVRCDNCGGNGTYEIADDYSGAILKCEPCDGTGLVNQTIAGARLIERSRHLRVE